MGSSNMKALLCTEFAPPGLATDARSTDIRSHNPEEVGAQGAAGHAVGDREVADEPSRRRRRHGRIPGQKALEDGAVQSEGEIAGDARRLWDTADIGGGIDAASEG